MLPTEQAAQAAQADLAYTRSTPFQDPFDGSWVRLMVMRPTGQPCAPALARRSAVPVELDAPLPERLRG